MIEDHDGVQGHEHSSHGPHPHGPDIEDLPATDTMVLAEAVCDLLLAKRIIDAAALRRTIEDIDRRGPETGARVVARAWIDPGYRDRLLTNVNEAARELGIDAGPIPIRAVANRAGLHNLVVCTLCSCYPRLLIGLPPDWYKSRAYRSRAVREPRSVLRELGLELDAGVLLEVHDSTADLRYMVLPERPASTEGWAEDRLAALVTRDCMIGTAVPHAGHAGA